MIHEALCLHDLAKLWEGAYLETFLAELGVPCLLVSESDGQTSANFDTTCSNFSKRSMPGDAQVLPLAKRPGANAFDSMITIGRAPNNDVIVADRAVSKFHAYVRVDEQGNYLLWDASSSNGTRVDGQPLSSGQPVVLSSGAEIVLGGSILARFVDPSDLFALLQETSAHAA